MLVNLTVSAGVIARDGRNSPAPAPRGRGGSRRHGHHHPRRPPAALYRPPGCTPRPGDTDEAHALHDRLPPPPICGAATGPGVGPHARAGLDDRPQPATRPNLACVLAT